MSGYVAVAAVLGAGVLLVSAAMVAGGCSRRAPRMRPS